MKHWIDQVAAVEPWKKYSQCGEEAYLKFIFDSMGIEQGTLVDIGAGDGYALSNTRYFIEQGWKGILFDANPRGNKEVHQEFINTDNVQSLFEKYKVPKNLDLLSIDIDSTDYWVLERILKSKYRPKVIIAEINGCIPEGIAKTVPNVLNLEWSNDDYYGFSYDAGKKLAEANGYLLVHQIVEMNIILIDKEVVKDYYDLNLFTMKVAFKARQYHPMCKEQKDWIYV